MCSRCERDGTASGGADDPIVVLQWLDQEDAWYRETIRDHGWAIQYVFADEDGDERSPSLGYTVGLTGFDHPEVVVFGLGEGGTARVLNALGDRVRAGERLRDGDVVDLGFTPVTLFDLPNPAEVVFTANSVYGRREDESVPALHAVYADRHGSWPWEPGCELPPWLQPMPGQFRA
jgi:hypothetical protein